MAVTNLTNNVNYTTIADAIAAAAAGDTIQVTSGTYAESFTIDKAIRLIGPNQGSAATENPRASEAWINGKVTIAADNVIIDGFRLNNANGPLTWQGNPNNFELKNSYLTGYTAANSPRFGDANNYNGPAVVTGWNISGNYIGDMTGVGTSGSLYLAGLNDSDISNNIFSNPQAAHLYLSSLTDVRIENNTFNNGVNEGNTNYSGYWFEIKGTNDGVLIKGNNGQGNSGGIQLWGEESSNFVFNNITIEENTFENFVNAGGDLPLGRSGTTPAIVASASVENGHSGSNLIIRNNNIRKDLGTLLDNTPPSIDLPHLIDIRGAFNGVTIEGNTLAYTGAITNFPLATGLSLTGSLPGEVNVSNNQFLGEQGTPNNAAYYAIDLQPVFLNGNNTRNPDKYGTFAGNLNITGNTISGWQVGVVLRDAGQITTPVNIAGNTLTNNSFNVFDGVPPTITAGQTFTYQENQAQGFLVGTVAAEDNLNNTDNVGIRNYAIVSGNENGFFSINESSGEISLTPAGVASAANDFERTPNSFTLGITATDAGEVTSPPTNVTITVTNDPTDTIVATPTIDTIAGNDIVNFSEADAGFNITGTGIPGATVALVFDSGHVLAGGNTVTVGGNGTWSVNVNIDDVDAFDQGTEVITATQRLNGIDSQPVTKQFTVDTLEPTVSITSNAPDIATGSVTYTVTFSEGVTGFTDGDITVTNGTKGTFTQVSPTAYTLVVTPNANFEGELTVAVAEGAAQDAAGNPSLAVQPVVQRVDTLMPAAPKIEPIATDNRVNIAEASGFAITGTGEVGAQVTVSFSTGIFEKTVQVGGDGKWSVPVTATDVTAFGQGSKTITATQTDIAGNVSSTVTQSFTVDRVRPLTPVINVISGNDIVNANEASVGFSITGTGEAGATLTLNFSSGGTLASGNTLAVPANGNWSVPITAADVTAFGQGAEIITATQTDLAGNVSSSTSRSIQVDTVVPSVPVINPIAGDDIVNANEASGGFRIRGTGEAGAILKLSFSSGGIADKTVVVSGNNGWSIALTPQEIAVFGEGQQVITATQTDAAGNTSPAATRTITVDTVPPLAPTIGNITPDNIVNATEAQAGFNITGTGEVGATVTLEFDSNRALLSENTAVVGADGNWSIAVAQADVIAFGQGLETITATQRGGAGNVSQQATLPFTVDTVAPGRITIDAIAGDNIINADEAEAGLTITGTGENGATVTLSVGAESRTALVTNGTWSISVTEAEITALGQGDIQINGTQTDGAGNTSPVVTRTITLATQPPSAPGINQIAGDNIVNVAESQTGFNITGTGQPGAIVNLTLDSGRVLQAGNTVTVGADGTWSIPVFTADITALGQGAETITATQTDVAGNVSESANLTFTVDTQVLITAAESPGEIVTRLQAASVQSARVNAAGMTEAQLASVVANIAKVQDNGITDISLNNGNSLGTINGLLSSRTVEADTVAINASGIGTNILSAIATNINKVSSLTNLSLSNSENDNTIRILLGSDAVALNSVLVNAQGMNQGQHKSLADAIAKISNLTNLSLSGSDTAPIIATLLDSAAVASDSVAVDASGMGVKRLQAVANQGAKVSTLTNLRLTDANTANATVITNLLSAADDSSVSVITRNMATDKLSAIQSNFGKVSSANIGGGQTLTLAADTVNNATINGNGTLAVTGNIGDSFFTFNVIGTNSVDFTDATFSAGLTSLTLSDTSKFILTPDQASALSISGTDNANTLTIDVSGLDFTGDPPTASLAGLNITTLGGNDTVGFRFGPGSDQRTVILSGSINLGSGVNTLEVSNGEIGLSNLTLTSQRIPKFVTNSTLVFTASQFKSILDTASEGDQASLAGSGTLRITGTLAAGEQIDLRAFGENFVVGGINAPTIEFPDYNLTNLGTDAGSVIILPNEGSTVVVKALDNQGQLVAVPGFDQEIVPLAQVTVFTELQLRAAVIQADVEEVTLGNSITLSGNLELRADNLTLVYGTNTLILETGATLTLTAAQASGAAIAGQGTVVLTGPGNELTADLSNINVSEVTLAVDGALNVTAATLAGTLTFDVNATGNLTLTAAQASDRSITNAGQVTITGLGSDEVDLGGITGTGIATANLAPGFVTLAGDTNLGNVAVTVADQTLTLTAAQASGKSITGTGAVTVTGLTATTDLSGVGAGLNVTATVTAATNISGNNNLGTVDSFQVDAGTLTLSAAQAGGKSITGTGAVTVTGLTATTDLSGVGAGLNVTATVTAATDISGNNNLGTVDTFQVNAGQTLTLSAVQASAKSITGTGALTVTGFTASTDLSGVGAGLNNVTVIVKTVEDLTNLDISGVDVFEVEPRQTLTLTAAQANGRTITGDGTVRIVELVDFPTPNLSQIAGTVTVILDGTAISINTPGDTLINAGESAATSISGTAIGAEGQTVTVVFTDSNSNQVEITGTVTSGAWTVTPNLSTLGEGVINVTAAAEDIAGKLLSADAPALLTLDFTPPAAPIINPVTGDNAINATEAAAGFTITGTGEAEATVTVTLGGTSVGTVDVEEGGNWSLDIAPGQLVEGTLDLVARQTDAAGNIGPNQSQELLVRTSAIAVAITSIGSADSIVSRAAGDNRVVGTAQPGNVTILLGQQVLGAATVDANGNFTYNLTTVNLQTIGQGAGKTITASQTDAAGNTGTSPAFSFAVDTIAPTVTITNIGSADSIVSGAAGDNTVVGRAEAGSGNVTIRFAGTALGTAAVDAQGNFTYNLTTANLQTIGQGAGKTITASQTDAVANTGTSPAFSFAVDTIAPTVTITNIGSADSIVSGAAGDNTVVGRAEAGSGDVTIRFAGTALGTAVVDAQGNFTYNLTTANLQTIGQGAGKTITASQTDAVANTGTSPAFSFAVDTIAPTVTITNSLASGAIASGDDITYTFTFSEAVTNFATEDITVTNGTKGAFNPVSSNVYTLVVTPQPNFQGDLTVAVAAASAQDTAGNPSPSAQTVVPVDSIIGGETFKVTSFEENASGFVLTFNNDLNLGVLNLYRGLDLDNPLAPVTDLPDLRLTDGNGNIIKGSLIWDQGNADTLTFVKTGNVLAPGSYTLTLESRNDGFVSTNGRLLDGDANNVSGGNYVQNFTVNSSTAPVLTLPDFSRAPGQEVNIRGGGQFNPLPIRISNPGGVQNISFTLQYDPDLLDIKEASVAADGWSFTSSPVIDPLTGRAQFALTGSTLNASTDLITLNAEVKDTATYGAQGLLQILPGAGLVGDSAVQLVALVGDTVKQQGYVGVGSASAGLISRVNVGFDTGFRAFPVTDPLIIGDATGNGGLDAGDATVLRLASVGQPSSFLPPLV
ncbi:Ig-like domain-containing protein [Umezakia ovalisporum]|uniref:Ig-like domain-containing protein n=1 Tax=Umezakia ovalisporum TaxID=75695 RepID=UPI0024754F90|nr:Ig-like domain-containing protein [Umezakia ovalisporum]MDH6082324.1 Ig-like domain-containing protein [Umezakia ovalisporum FSS-44]